MGPGKFFFYSPVGFGKFQQNIARGQKNDLGKKIVPGREEVRTCIGKNMRHPGESRRGAEFIHAGYRCPPEKQCPPPSTADIALPRHHSVLIRSSLSGSKPQSANKVKTTETMSREKRKFYVAWTIGYPSELISQCL